MAKQTKLKVECLVQWIKSRKIVVKKEPTFNGFEDTRAKK